MIDFSAVPDHLLAPLFEAAGATLRALPPEQVPPVARPLLRFDLRGMNRGPARLQLRRALDGESSFRERVGAVFCALPEVQATIEGWNAANALAIANTAASAAGDVLAVLACALIAGEPDGAERGLGIVVAVDDARRRARDDDKEAAANVARVSDLQEQVRRLDTARATTEKERDTLAEQLRGERKARRERDDRAATDASVADARVSELERALEAQRSRVASAETESVLASRRADAIEAEARELRAVAAAPAAAPAAREPVDVAAIADAARAARDLAETLDGIANAATTRPPAARPAGAPRARSASGRRARPKLPGGLMVDSVVGADAMVRGGSMVLVVDGYNVSKAGWPNPSLEIERESLVSALHRLHLTAGTEVIVVFDGDGTQSYSGPRRPGVRVMFSKAGEEADTVVVELVAMTPLEKAVVVASSDKWVREHAETFGAVAISAATMVGVLRG